MKNLRVCPDLTKIIYLSRESKNPRNSCYNLAFMICGRFVHIIRSRSSWNSFERSRWEAIKPRITRNIVVTSNFHVSLPYRFFRSRQQSAWKDLICNNKETMFSRTLRSVIFDRASADPFEFQCDRIILQFLFRDSRNEAIF